MSQSAKLSFTSFLPIVILFIAAFLFTWLGSDRLAAWNINADVINGGNLLLFLVTLFTWFFHKKALSAGNTQAFLRNVYGGMMLRMFVCIIAFFIYVSLVAGINKPAIFAVMFLYLVYTFTEIAVLLKYSKRIRNA
ncbi:MAG TPA: hypothetical protein VJ647_01305 [Chitinophagaceae bacterium]|nr:hypothetical protein [Chitinophagaceae bacterium]